MSPSILTEALVEQASSHSGHGAFRPATDRDAVDGVRPRLVAEPPTPEAVAATLGWAASERMSVLVRGGGTKLQWGGVARPVDLLLSTVALDAVVEHRYGDLTATIEAGAALAEVNTILKRHGQWLPLDPPWAERATIGGIIATNDSGPRRHRHGTPRDLIIGVTVARGDGQLAKAGGIVVKNVAGYDLSRLLTGSFGCLGVIVSATFKLAPVAAASRTVRIDLDSSDAMVSAVATLSSSPLTPTAAELDSRAIRLMIRFESVEVAVEQQARQAVELLAGHGRSEILRADDERVLWAKSRGYWEEPGTVVKLSTLPTVLIRTIAWLQDVCATHDVQMAATGRAGLGVADVWLDGTIESQARVIVQLRDRFSVGQGSAVIRRGAPALRQVVDPWGPIGDGLPVMQAVKKQFDPEGRLNPGRGPGGV